MNERQLQDQLSNEFQQFLDECPKRGNTVQQFQNRAPAILRSIIQRAEAIRTNSGREIEPSRIDIEVRKAGEGCFIVRLQFFGETRIWMEES